MRHYLLSIVLVACGLCTSSISQPPAPAAPQIAAIAVPVDLAALHREAQAALDNLRLLRERKLAMAASAAF